MKIENYTGYRVRHIVAIQDICAPAFTISNFKPRLQPSIMGNIVNLKTGYVKNGGF